MAMIIRHSLCELLEMSSERSLVGGRLFCAGLFHASFFRVDARRAVALDRLHALTAGFPSAFFVLTHGASSLIEPRRSHNRARRKWLLLPSRLCRARQISAQNRFLRGGSL